MRPLSAPAATSQEARRSCGGAGGTSLPRYARPAAVISTSPCAVSVSKPWRFSVPKYVPNVPPLGVYPASVPNCARVIFVAYRWASVCNRRRAPALGWRLSLSRVVADTPRCAEAFGGRAAVAFGCAGCALCRCIDPWPCTLASAALISSAAYGGFLLDRHHHERHYVLHGRGWAPLRRRRQVVGDEVALRDDPYDLAPLVQVASPFSRFLSFALNDLRQDLHAKELRVKKRPSRAAVGPRHLHSLPSRSPASRHPARVCCTPPPPTLSRGRRVGWRRPITSTPGSRMPWRARVPWISSGVMT